MYCSNCGRETNKKVCSECGVKQGKIKKFCTWCGTELQANASICTNCNEKVKKNPIGSLILLLLDLVFIFLFFLYLGGDENYKMFLIQPVAFLGIIVSLPVWRSIIRKKTHGKQKLRKPVQLVRYICVILLLTLILNVFIPMGKYNVALETAAQDPVKAKELFLAMGDYKDAKEQITKLENTIIGNARIALEKGDWKTAEELLKSVPENESIADIETEMLYQKGVALLSEYKYHIAKDCFIAIGDYKDASELMKNVGIGLCGNHYTHTDKSYSPLRVSLYSMIFSEYGTADQPTTVHIMAHHTPKLYAGGMDLDVDSKFQYRVIDGVLYGYNEDLNPPEDLKDWIIADKLSDIKWENGIITSFERDGVEYTLKED